MFCVQGQEGRHATQDLMELKRISDFGGDSRSYGKGKGEDMVPSKYSLGPPKSGNKNQSGKSGSRKKSGRKDGYQGELIEGKRGDW